jgi:aspartyl protease family protein
MGKWLRVWLLAAATPLAAAQSVTLNGAIGTRQALLVIDGQPRAVAVGATVKGVRLLSLWPTHAEVEVGGQRRTLALGAVQVRMAGGGAAQEIVLTADPRGHFLTAGAIDYRNSTRRGMAETANGRVPAYGVMLSSVRVGEVEVANVEAVVLPAAMPYALLGNSFLTRFQMKRENDVLRLEKRPN